MRGGWIISRNTIAEKNTHTHTDRGEVVCVLFNRNEIITGMKTKSFKLDNPPTTLALPPPPPLPCRSDKLPAYAWAPRHREWAAKLHRAMVMQ